MARCQRYVYVLVRDLQMFVREDVDGGAEAFRVFKRRAKDHALGAARPACTYMCGVCPRVACRLCANLVCGCRARDRGVRVL